MKFGSFKFPKSVSILRLHNFIERSLLKIDCHKSGSTLYMYWSKFLMKIESLHSIGDIGYHF